MAKPYLIQRGDTLGKIAKAQYGDSRLAALVADYNGLPDAGQIFAGQRILLPTAKEIAAAQAPPTTAGVGGCPPAPCGFDAIRATFGDLLSYIEEDGRIDPKWERDNMVRVGLPFSVPLAWDTRRQAKSVCCHKLVAPQFEEAFRRIAADGLNGAVTTYGGCYAFRPKRNGVKPSTHSWGIAIDLNPNTNAMGTAGNMDPRLVALFEGLGFVWGGRWTGGNKDPMHFQYCSGY